MSAEAFNFGGKPKPAPAKITKKEPEAATVRFESSNRCLVVQGPEDFAF